MLRNIKLMLPIYAALAAWLIYDRATASEAENPLGVILSYVVMACLFAGIAGGLITLFRGTPKS